VSRRPLVLGLVAAAVAFAAVVAATAGSDEEPAAPARASTQADPGALVFARMGCGGCHTLGKAGATGPIGPSLGGIARRYDAQALRAKILNPGTGGQMPEDFGERMSDAELDALVAYLLAG
jgi:mono/diheme cytochrome c family protein